MRIIRGNVQNVGGTMRKIKIVWERYVTTFEHTVNNFIATHNVVDIQYQYGGPNGAHSVMIVYEED